MWQFTTSSFCLSETVHKDDSKLHRLLCESCYIVPCFAAWCRACFCMVELSMSALVVHVEIIPPDVFLHLFRGYEKSVVINQPFPVCATGSG